MALTEKDEKFFADLRQALADPMRLGGMTKSMAALAQAWKVAHDAGVTPYEWEAAVAFFLMTNIFDPKRPDMENAKDRALGLINIASEYLDEMMNS